MSKSLCKYIFEIRKWCQNSVGASTYNFGTHDEAPTTSILTRSLKPKLVVVRLDDANSTLMTQGKNNEQWHSNRTYWNFSQKLLGRVIKLKLGFKDEIETSLQSAHKIWKFSLLWFYWNKEIFVFQETFSMISCWVDSLASLHWVWNSYFLNQR